MRVEKKSCLYNVVKIKLLTKLGERRIKQFWAKRFLSSKAISVSFFFFIWQMSFFLDTELNTLIWMSYVSYGFDLWKKYILYFLWLSRALFFDSNAAVFKLKDATKKWEADPSDKQICRICCYGYWGEQSFQLVFSVMFLCTYSCDSITVFIAEDKNGSFLKCAWVIWSYWDKTQGLTKYTLDLF